MTTVRGIILREESLKIEYYSQSEPWEIVVEGYRK